MIYRSVAHCMEEICGGWAGLQTAVADAATRAQEIYPDPRSQAQQDIVDALDNAATRCQAEQSACDDYREGIPGQRGEMVGLLVATRDRLVASLAVLNQDVDLRNADNTGVRTTLAAITFPDGSDATAAVRHASTLADALDASIEQCLQEAEELQTDEGSRANLADIRRSVSDQTAYPVLTRETSPNGGGTGATARGVSASPLGQRVSNALREVLGWRPRATDPRGFAAALTQSFTCRVVQGRTECVYEPRSYTVQADVGAVTGAQASLYTRARAALDQSVPILERLEPLRTDADDDDVQASRAIVHSQLTELVDELGQQGGPRVQRIDALFEHLLGVTRGVPLPDPDDVDGSMGEFRDDFGLTQDHVSTVDEERRLTDYVTMLDYIDSLRTSWTNQSRFFDRIGPEVYLGTQLVLLGRALAVLAESTVEVADALDSVFLGQAERQTLRLTFGTGQAPMFVHELLSWVEHFASEEGRRLIKEGKAGVRALFPTIERLRDLASQARTREFGGLQSTRVTPAAYGTARVQRAMQELVEHLNEAVALAEPFRG